jgi:hypothetical protein
VIWVTAIPEFRLVLTLFALADGMIMVELMGDAELSTIQSR